MAKLLLVRHGETKGHSRERFWGRTDVELSELGMKQAEQVRERLAAGKIHAAYSSNLKRTNAAARIIAAPHQLEPVACAELDEIDFGEFEGLTFEEIRQKHPELASQMINWSVRPSFPGGESTEEVHARVTRFLPRLSKHTAEETVLIVAHAGTLRFLLCSLLDIDPGHWRQFRLALSSLSIVETYPRGAILTLLNDVSHLEDNLSP